MNSNSPKRVNEQKPGWQDFKLAPPPATQSDLFKMMWNALPEEERQFAAETRQDLDNLQWRLGDTANRWYEIIVANQIPATKIDVCALVAYLLDNEMSGPTTIERYAYQAEFYPDAATRDHYGILPSSHLRYAMGWGEDWQAILDWDLQQLDRNGGRFVSCKRLMEHFEPDKREPAGIPNLNDIEQPQPGRDRPPAHQPASPYVVDRVRSETIHLRDDLQQLQREQPKLAAKIAAIIRLCEETLSYMS